MSHGMQTSSRCQKRQRKDLPCFVAIKIYSKAIRGLPRWQSGKESTCQCRRHRRYGFDQWVGEIPWKKKQQLTPVFLPEKSHGQRSLAGYSPQGCKGVGHNLATKQQHIYLDVLSHILFHHSLLQDIDYSYLSYVACLFVHFVYSCVSVNPKCLIQLSISPLW